MFQSELGSAQLEYGSKPRNLEVGSYNSLLKEIKEIRLIVKNFAEKNNSYFITKSIPPFLELDPEKNNENFNTKEIYKIEEEFWKDKFPDKDIYEIKDENKQVISKMTDDNKSLAFVCGIHVNIQPKDENHCKDIFNYSLNLIPFFSGLGTNGGFLNKKLDKKDYRLHIGVLSEDLINDNYVYDVGMPDSYIDSIDEYFIKQAVKDSIYYIDNKNKNLSYINSIRETSWSFIQIKLLENNFLIEYRPISVQITSDIIASFHIFTILFIEYSIFSGIELTPITELHQDLKKALELGYNARIFFNGKETRIKNLFLDIIEPLKIYVLDKGLLSEQEFDEVVNNIKTKINKEEYLNNNIQEYIMFSHNDLLEND